MNHWLRDTLIGLLFVVPAILAISFFRRIFNISAEVFIPWYYLGITATLFISTLVSGESLGKFINQPKWVILGMLLVGLTVGAGANIVTFRARAGATSAESSLNKRSRGQPSSVPFGGPAAKADRILRTRSSRFGWAGISRGPVGRAVGRMGCGGVRHGSSRCRTSRPRRSPQRLPRQRRERSTRG